MEEKRGREIDYFLHQKDLVTDILRNSFRGHGHYFIMMILNPKLKIPPTGPLPTGRQAVPTEGGAGKFQISSSCQFRMTQTILFEI
jgi:hypothetical protein